MTHWDVEEPDLPRARHWDGPGLDAWDAWSPAEAADRLAAVRAPWCVVGGWAVDLFVGHQTRDHEDLEIAIIRDRFDEVRAALRGFLLCTVGDGEVRYLGSGTEPPPDKHQNWVLDSEDRKWRMDVMVEPGDDTTWVYRRDERISAPRDFMVGRSTDGIPFLMPHGALLFKAKPEPRPKDESDFASCLPLLDDRRREWLAAAIRKVEPDHPWISRLS